MCIDSLRVRGGGALRRHPHPLIVYGTLKPVMVATAATSAFFPVPSSDSLSKSVNKGNGVASGGLRVKANVQAPRKVNGSSVVLETSLEPVMKIEDSTTAPPRTLINQLPDWSMLLAAITTVFLSAEKQWTVPDCKPKRPDMLVDPFCFGRIVWDGLIFRQNFSIRSYEIGADRTASIETTMNYLQVVLLPLGK